MSDTMTPEEFEGAVMWLYECSDERITNPGVANRIAAAYREKCERNEKLERANALLLDGLQTVIEHHEHLNQRVMRPREQSNTIRYCEQARAAALAELREGRW